MHLPHRKKEAQALSSSLGQTEGGRYRKLSAGCPSLQCSSVSLSQGDGTEEKKGQEVTQRGCRVEETFGHKSPISGRTFQIPSRGAG